ncbi:hypothetical protein ACB098_03G006100 [Castanea mollissima]
MGLLGPIHDFLLVFLGSGLILGGIGVILLTNTIHSAFSLGLVLVCISLFYILSNSHLVAAAQLLIYVGAINVLIIFAVMFMNGSEYYKDLNLWTVGDGVTLLICTILFCLLMATISDTSWYGIIWTTRSNQIIEQDLISNSQQIGIHLSTDFFLPFELISIILLAALIGAIAVARQ